MTRATLALPTLLFAASLIGLVSALTGDGVRDWLSWAMLSLPVAAIAWASLTGRPPRASVTRPT